MPVDIFLSIILSACVATYCLLTVALWAPGVGLPRLDFSKVLGKFMYGPSYDGKQPYFGGMASIYMNGIVFALMYSTIMAGYLPGPAVIKGGIWGFILFLVSGLWFVPNFLKEGYFLSNVHERAWVTSLIVHVAYGLVVGWLAPVHPLI